LRRAAARAGGGQPARLLLAQPRRGPRQPRPRDLAVLRRALRQHLGAGGRHRSAAAHADARRPGAGRRAARHAGAGRGWDRLGGPAPRADLRSEEHTSELQSPVVISYAVFCLKKKKPLTPTTTTPTNPPPNTHTPH